MMPKEPAGCPASIEDIRDRMEDAKAAGRPFAVLLGTGASWSAGIPTAVEMAREVAEGKYREETGNDPPEDPEELWCWLEEHPRCKQHFEEWRKANQDVDDAFLRYAVCMGELLGPQSRKDLLLEKCKNARGPNWAHLFVAQLIDEGYVDTVLTTNFDDLMQRALILYPDNQIPAVCAHPQSAAHVESAPQRPQIVYLHGSALYYDTCHTPGEVEKLREGLREALHRIIHDRGLIVVGYRGAEPDVMLALQGLLEARPLAHRLYWIAHERRHDDLAALARDRLPWGVDCRLMCGQDADEFFADLCGHEKGLGLEVPPFLLQPFDHGLRAISGIAEMPGSPDRAAATIVAEARRELEAAADELRSRLGREKFQQAIEEHRKGTLESLLHAIELYEKAVEERSEFPEAFRKWGDALDDVGRLQREKDPAAARERFKTACDKYEQAVEQRPEYPEALYNWANALIHLGHLADDRGEKQEGHAVFEQAREKAQQAADLGREECAYNVACADALLGNVDEAFEGLRGTLQKGRIAWSHVAEDEDWDDVREDLWYRDLEEEFGDKDGDSENGQNEGTEE